MEPKAGVPAARLEPTQYAGGGVPPPSAAKTVQGLMPRSVEIDDAMSTERLLDEVNVPARIALVSGVRERMAAAARSIGFSDEAVDGIRLAVGEAYVNAVKHGSRPSENKGDDAGDEIPGDDDLGDDDRGASVDLRAFQVGNTLVIEIQDKGSGFQPDDVILTQPGELKSCGRGLIFMRMFMDEVTFEFNEGGTLVRMKKQKPLGAHGTSDAGS